MQQHHPAQRINVFPPQLLVHASVDGRGLISRRGEGKPQVRSLLRLKTDFKFQMSLKSLSSDQLARFSGRPVLFHCINIHTRLSGRRSLEKGGKSSD